MVFPLLPPRRSSLLPHLFNSMPSFSLFRKKKQVKTNKQTRIKQSKHKKRKQTKNKKNTYPLRDTHIHKPYKNTKSETIIDKQKTTNINNNPPKQSIMSKMFKKIRSFAHNA